MPTKIEWADEVWNPVTGCSKVSPGCANCYAERFAKRLAGRCGYPKDNPFQVKVHYDRLKNVDFGKKPKRIFVCSMSDLFHDKVPKFAIDNVLEIIAANPLHTFIVLTKRPQNLDDKLYEPDPEMAPIRELGGGDYLPNLWLGISAENQKCFDKRIGYLLDIPAAKHIVSLEPLLGPINLGEHIKKLDWVIVGGESGNFQRYCEQLIKPDWVRSIRDQCVSASIPFFFKQWGTYCPYNQLTEDGYGELEKALGGQFADRYDRLFHLGKRLAGRQLDEETWDQVPQ